MILVPWVADFWELSTDRAMTMGGYGPIPSRAITEWTAGWPEDVADLFRRCIRAMDTVFLENIGKPAPLPPADAATMDRILGG